MLTSVFSSLSVYFLLVWLQWKNCLCITKNNRVFGKSCGYSNLSNKNAVFLCVCLCWIFEEKTSSIINMSSESKSFAPGKVLTAADFPPSSETFRIFPNSEDDEIVISGISGRFPKCDNVEQLAHNLYNKVCFRHFFAIYQWMRAFEGVSFLRLRISIKRDHFCLRFQQ